MEVADYVDNTSLQTIDGKNTITDENGKQLITTTMDTDYPVTDNTVYQTQTNKTTANNSTNESTSNTGNSAISTLLNNYNNKNNLVVEGTENNTATGSMVLVDLSKTNLIALNQISENAPIPGTYNGPMHALGNGAGQDGFDAGGGTDNTITYNDTASMGSLPVGDGSKLMILFALCYIFIISYKQNIKITTIKTNIV